MTDQEIAHFMNRLQEEDEMLEGDRVRRFDGSDLWKQLTEKMAEEVRLDLQSPQPGDSPA